MKQAMIGLEVHVYLKTEQKLFCECLSTSEKGVPANTLVCEVCTGQPGAKPLLPNSEAIKKSVQIALMLGCKINNSVEWMRKHYSWPDLPKGYQTTISGANSKPLGIKGKFNGIRINSMHLEEDPAAWNPKNGCIDYNRSGMPLVEIVTEPDFVYSEEVEEWMGKLLHVLNYLRAVDHVAGIKADVNVNIPGQTDRVEIKNVHSIESIKKAIDYEIDRQKKEGSVLETRRYDEKLGKTMRMRGKEKQDDYRFVSDPDLLRLNLSDKYVNDVKKHLPEFPEEKLKKLIKKYKIGKKDAAVLAKELDIAEFFESVSKKIDGKYALHWITTELLRVLNWNCKKLYEVDMGVDHFVKLLSLVKKGEITASQAKKILNDSVPKSFDPNEGLKKKITDKKEIKKILDEVINENESAFYDYLRGNSKIINFLLGEVMKKSGSRADNKVVIELLRNEYESNKKASKKNKSNKSRRS